MNTIVKHLKDELEIINKGLETDTIHMNPETLELILKLSKALYYIDKCDEEDEEEHILHKSHLSGHIVQHGLTKHNFIHNHVHLLADGTMTGAAFLPTEQIKHAIQYPHVL